MADFVNNATATVSMRIPTTAAGNIAQSGDVVKGSKLGSIPGIKKDAHLNEVNKVFDAIYGTIGGGSFDSMSAVRTIKEGVQ